MLQISSKPASFLNVGRCCGSTSASVAALSASLRIRGVSGDLLPILEWRFNRQPARPVNAAKPSPRPNPELEHASIQTPFTNDYPQFLGPHRTGVVDGPELARDWQARPPQSLWRQPVGPAWSGFAIRGQMAVTMEQSGDSELVTCYDLRSGKLLWSHSDRAHYKTTIAGEGPRTTPTIHGNRVFTMGAMGLLNCLDLATGQTLWMKDIPKDNQGAVGDWGVSCAPLVCSNFVIVTTGAAEGRSLAAYLTSNGQRAWTSGNHRSSYSSPVVATIAGEPQILIFNATRLSSHDSVTGQPLWEHPWPTGHPHIATPLVLERDRVLVSSGYGVGSELLQIQRAPDGKWAVQRLWKSNRLKSKFANLIYCGGYIYGLDDGILACLDAATGRLAWKEGRYGHGQIISIGDLLLIMAESGDVVLVQASPEAPKELTRFRALTAKTWNPPALAGRYLVVRNDQQAACFALPTL